MGTQQTGAARRERRGRNADDAPAIAKQRATITQRAAERAMFVPSEMDDRYTELREEALAAGPAGIGAEALALAEEWQKIAAAQGACYRAIHGLFDAVALEHSRISAEAASDFRNRWPVTGIDRDLASALQGEGLAQMLAGNLTGNAPPTSNLPARWEKRASVIALTPSRKRRQPEFRDRIPGTMTKEEIERMNPGTKNVTIIGKTNAVARGITHDVYGDHLRNEPAMDRMREIHRKKQGGGDVL